jgi:O-antigen/teichoic acid export membrane protein
LIVPKKSVQEIHSRLFSTAALYGLSDVAVLAVGGFLLIPLYTHSLSQTEFGQYVAVRANVDIGTYLLQLGLPSAVARLYFDRKRSGQEDAYLSGVISFFLLFAALVATMTFFFGSWVWKILSPAVPDVPALSLTLAIAIAGGLGSLAIVWLRSEHRVATVVALQLGAAVMLAITSAILLLTMDMGLPGILVGLLVSALLPVFALILLFGRTFRFAMRLKDITETLHYALPILVGYLAYFTLNRSGMLMLQRHVSVEELAIFGLAQQLSMIATLACSSFGSALQPAVFGAGPQEVNKLLGKAALQLTLVMLAVCSALMLFAGELLGLIAPDIYAGSAVLMLLLVAANFTTTFSLMADTVLLYHFRPKTSVLISIASAIVAAGLGWLLIPILYAEGAAISVAAGLAFRMVVSQWVAWHISGQSQFGLALSALVIIFLVAISASALRKTSIPLTMIIPIKLIACASAVGALYLIQRRFFSSHA